MDRATAQKLRAIVSAVVVAIALVLTGIVLQIGAMPTNGAMVAIYLLRLLGMFLAAGLSIGLIYLITAPLLRNGPTPPANAPTTVTGDDQTRGRLAWLVLGVGSGTILFIAILVVTGTTLFSLLLPNNDPAAMAIRGRYDTLVFGIFNAVLPVLATWVGTVLAFYFGSENFRQAAQSTRDVMSDRLTAKTGLTDLMTPYERIARIETDRATAQTISMQRIIDNMSQAATRVILFDQATQTPIYVIRSSVPPMPAGWITADYRGGAALQQQTVSDYLALNNGANKADAERFSFIEASATPEDALTRMAKDKSDDLFITADGQPSSRVVGWATRYSLRKG